MLNKLKKDFLAKIPLKLIRYSLITVFLPIAVLISSGAFASLDLAIYDFVFFLRPVEATDQRIVIVEWDESSIQMLEETTISDDTLSVLLKKIREQQPRIIGLDIYRDIPVLSPRLSDEENIQAYDSLQEVFRSTPQLIGIEKVVEPRINPPKILKDKEQVAASDLPSDRDRTIRRAYVFPQVDQEGGPAGIPYLGVVLGYQYLASEGYSASKLDDYSLKIAKKSALDVTLQPLQAFAGTSSKEQDGLAILVNWRKGNPNFKRVSATEVISGQIPPDLFYAQIVLIGNVSASTADRHNLPLNRFHQGTAAAWTYGTEIPAQVASSIISAALDGRPLIKTIPKLIELALIIISAIAIILVIINKHKNLPRQNFYSTTLVYAFALTAILILGSIFALARGWWIPVAVAIGGLWIAYFSINYYFYRDREKKKVINLEMLIRDLQHSLGNPLNSITSSTTRIQTNCLEIEAGELEKVAILQKRAVNIIKQVNKIQRYRKRSTELISFGYLNPTNTPKKTHINQLIQEIVQRFITEHDYSYQVCVQEDYDPKLRSAKIDRTAIEIVLENLLDNAFYSVAPKAKTDEKYFPLVKIQTKKINHKIMEFRVEDNGVGIPDTLQPKIFQPFISFNSGQGLGLHLVQEIAFLYEGSIKVESIEHQGSTFIFTLPLKVERNKTSLLKNFLPFLR
jgi:adenylate cyclase